MTRRNIFEILEEEKDMEDEIQRIETLCEEESIRIGRHFYTPEELVDEYCLKGWKNRNRFMNCEEIREKLGIDIICRGSCSEELVLIYLEYMANIIQLCNLEINSSPSYHIERSYDYLRESVLGLIDDLNYEARVFEDKEQVILVEKNAATTAVAEIVEDEFVYDVLEYNHHTLKGNLDRKQRILKILADKFEEIRPQLKSINGTLESNTAYLLNKMNIRHNNMAGKNVIPYVRDMSKEDLETWYDETYQMILLSILEVDNIERNKKVKELKQVIDNK